MLREFEGLRLQAYPDPGSGGDPWTIGYGHTKGVKRGDTCTKEQAEAWLLEDAAEAEEAITRMVTVPLTQEQRDALVSFVFNLGAGNLKQSTLLRKLNAGDYTGAANEFKRWVNAAGKPMPGLIRRRAAEAALFTSQEKPMAPFIAAALPLLMQTAPALIRLFSDSPQGEKNAKAAEAVAAIAMQATGEANIEAATKAIEADPEKAAAFREQVHLSMGDLLGMVERVNAMEQGNIKAARAYNESEQMFLDFGWLKIKFVHLLSLLFVGFSGWFIVQNWAALTPELKGAVVSLMMIAGYNGVRDYWMGSSSGSDRKTSELLKK